MTNSKTKVYSDAELDEWRPLYAYGDINDGDIKGNYRRFLATIDALKAELALKDKVVEAARLMECVYRKNCVAKGEPSSVLDAVQTALNDLDKVMVQESEDKAHLIYEAPRDPNHCLKVRGVGRVSDEPRALLVCLSERPTDDELRSLHDFVRGWVP
jgi:hypothetical protein